MCGVFQVIQKGRPIDKRRFHAAVDSMRHRGPDSTGVHVDEHQLPDGQTVHTAFGHQRLAILDLTEGSHQPYRRGGNTLVYNGELYNFRDLADRLSQNGHTLETGGDTEVMFRCLSDDGANALSNFSGMWAFSYFNCRDHSILLSRDRYGKKPLFYYLDDATLIVSSTILSIHKYLSRKPTLRRQHLLSYFLSGTMYPSGEEQTHFEGVKQLLPGHVARFDLNRWSLHSRPYFNWFEGEAPVGEASDEGELARRVEGSVQARLISDRPVALLLSGGVDSSLVFSVLHATGAHQRLKVFLGDTGRCQDYAYARQCVEKLGVPAETIRLDYQTQSFDMFLDVCAHHEKPFLFNGNALAMPQMYRAIAEQGIPVVLDGTGGDEFFGGYWPRHLPHAFRQAIRDGQTQWINEVCAANQGAKYLKQSLAWARRNVSATAKPRAVLQTLKRRLHPFIRCSWREARDFRHPDPLLSDAQSFREALCRDVAPGGRLGEWVWHNDRNAMMSSVENRSPLLDHRLHPFLFSGFANKYVGPWNKHELRRVFSRFAALPTQWRKDKQGFRWDGKRFIRNNRSEILELIDASKWCAEVFNNRRFVRCAKRAPRLLESTIGKQALSIAGIEAAMKKEA